MERSDLPNGHARAPRNSGVPSTAPGARDRLTPTAVLSDGARLRRLRDRGSSSGRVFWQPGCSIEGARSAGAIRNGAASLLQSVRLLTAPVGWRQASPWSDRRALPLGERMAEM